MFFVPPLSLKMWAPLLPLSPSVFKNQYPILLSEVMSQRESFDMWTKVKCTYPWSHTQYLLRWLKMVIKFLNPSLVQCVHLLKPNKLIPAMKWCRQETPLQKYRLPPVWRQSFHTNIHFPPFVICHQEPIDMSFSPSITQIVPTSRHF